MKKFELVERSSGFWVVDDTGPVEGPFIFSSDAMEWIEKRSKPGRKVYKNIDPDPAKGVFRKLKAGEVIRAGDFGTWSGNPEGTGWVLTEDLCITNSVVGDIKTANFDHFRRIHCRRKD